MKKILIFITLLYLTNTLIAQEKERTFQFSLVTPLGTNWTDSHLYTNIWSLNLIGGYSYANTLFELGGIYNINTGYTKGTQIAGVFNYTSHAENLLQFAGGANLAFGGNNIFQSALGGNIANKITGGQISGLANLSGVTQGFQISQFGNLSQSLYGFQLSAVNLSNNAMGLQTAWIMNAVAETFLGAQIGVGANVLGEGAGVQIAGAKNYAGQFSGLQVSGFTNITGSFTGLQIAGLGNLTYSVEGVQIAALANLGEAAKGLQLAAIVNTSVDMQGSQIAGIFNFAKSMHGLQLGLINYAETTNGLQIGLVNIVRYEGKKDLEFSYSEALDTTVSFKLGSNPFYTIFSAGINYISEPLEYACGIGFGTQLNWNYGFSNQIEAIAYQLTEDGQFSNALNMLTQVKLLTSKQLVGGLNAFVGPTWNMTISQHKDENGNIGASLKPWSLWQKNTTNTHLNMWIGFSAGLFYRF